MMTINPSLMFSGSCGNAFRRYAALFGGEIVLMVTYGDSPAKSQVPDDWHEKVWFARLRAGGLDITGGDLASSETPSGFSMVIGVPNAAEADRVFAGLVEGGEVLMPLQATQWSPCVTAPADRHSSQVRLQSAVAAGLIDFHYKRRGRPEGLHYFSSSSARRIEPPAARRTRDLASL